MNENKKRRLLFLDGGGLNGAYSAGVIFVLGKYLPKDYFNAIYMSSVGVYAGTFFASGQFDTIENTWRNLVSGKQLINFLNPFIGKEILKLDYLTEIYRNQQSWLDQKKC
jgi:predicted patatin/cPLA2 family phospholipase